jgi:hypothetical protein
MGRQVLTEQQKKTAFARVSHSFFFRFFLSLLLLPLLVAVVWNYFIFSQPAKDRSFASVRSFIHFIFLLFPSFQFSCVFFLTSIKDLHDNATTWKKKRKKGLIAFTHRVMGAPSLFSPDSVGKKKFTRRNFTRPLVIFLSLIVS